MRRINGVRLGRMLGLGCAVAAGGCACRHGSAETASQDRTQALLTAARANHMSLFGDLPTGIPATYSARPVVSLKQHSFTEVGADFDPDVDRSGQWLVFASTRHAVHPDLYLKAVDGVAVTQLTSDPAPDVQPDFSPDGSRVAFASQRSGSWDIWVIGVGGGPPIQLTSGMGDEVHPSWSSDGSKLVYCSLPAEGGQWELWITDASAGGRQQFIGYGLFPEWSPAGDTIVYQRARERDSRWFSVWTVTLAGGEPQYPTEVVSGATQATILPSWSPDGKQIAYASVPAVFPGPGGTFPQDSGEVSDIWVVNADGSGPMRLTDGHTANYAPVFSPDGRVFFTSNRSGHENAWSLLPAASSARTWTADVPAQPGGAETAKAGVVRTASHDDGL